MTDEQKAKGYGHRARIGYTSPPLTSEIFPYEFYKLVPEGVTLLLTSLDVWEHSGPELQDSYARTIRAAGAMGQAEADLIILGGGPVLGAKGAEKVGDLVKAAEDASGVPVTTVNTAYTESLRAVGAHKIVSIGNGHTGPGAVGLRDDGIEVLGAQGLGDGQFVDSTRVPSEEVLVAGRALMKAHPEADTIWIGWPHRASVDRIESMEQELGVSVVSATQAIVWHGLRKCGIKDSVSGYGRLMRDR
jgi:maleate cis-trans isomerase